MQDAASRAPVHDGQVTIRHKACGDLIGSGGQPTPLVAQAADHFT
ncbi:hypothetical protein [Pseudodesulfovibrio aespoeensis]|nr:hypothetical protein [Pseudodesulfovibrio aespoeensis]